MGNVVFAYNAPAWSSLAASSTNSATPVDNLGDFFRVHRRWSSVTISNDVTVTLGYASAQAVAAMIVYDVNFKYFYIKAGSTTGCADAFYPATVASYALANQDATASLASGSNTRIVQTFDGTGGIISRLSVLLKKSNSPTGNMYAAIYATSGGVPTGSPVATSPNFDVSTLTGSYLGYEFNFTTYPTLTAGTNNYAIGVVYSGASTSPNTVDVGIDSSSPSHSGTGYLYSGSWGSIAQDMCFLARPHFEATINASLGRYQWFSNVGASHRYWQIYIPSTTNGQVVTDGGAGFRIGHSCGLLSSTEVNTNPWTGYRFTASAAKPIVVEYDSGVEDRFSRGTRRKWQGTFQFKLMSPADVAQIATIDSGIGNKATPFAFFENMGDAGACYWVYKDFDLDVTWEYPSKIASLGTMTLTEVW